MSNELPLLYHFSFGHRDKRMREIRKRWKREEKERQEKERMEKEQSQNEAMELALVHKGHGGQSKGQLVQEGQQDKCHSIGA